MTLKVLIVGGGIGGLATAMVLRKQGCVVELVEIDPDWRVYGAGLSISGPTLRALDRLGVLDEVSTRGFRHEGFEFYDADNRCIAVMPSQRMPDSTVYGGGAIMRPVFKDILAQRTLDAGAIVRLGVTFKTITQSADHVEVAFTDGGSGRYDLLIGADGLTSRVRTTLFPHAPSPAYTGQGCWRAVFPRPADILRVRSYVGSPYKIGVNPVSNAEMYMYLLETRASKQRIADDQLHRGLQQILQSCGGVLRKMGESLNEQSRIMFRPLESLLLPRPWHRGRVLLIGDAVHATTPHLASGAGLALEDALVLGEELRASRSVEDSLQAFTDRRFERSRLVIENSVRLGELEQKSGATDEHRQLVHNSMKALTAPI